VVPERKSTRLTVAVPAAVGVAVNVTLEPKPNDEPVGVVASVTDGNPAPVTVTMTSGDVAVFRFGLVPVVTTDVSVTAAVSV
jgi:hypothetical protein